MPPTTTSEPSALPKQTPSRALRRPNGSRLAQVPHIAGLILGIYAVLVFLWSLSPVLRFLIHPLRLYIDDYYFDAPDTSFAWALVLGLLAAALASRKRIAWWLLTLYLVMIALANVVVVVADRDVNAAVACVVHISVISLLIAARSQFYTRVRRGAAWKALGVLVTGLAIGTLLGWGLVELFPGSLPSGERLLWAFNRVTTLAAIDNEQFGGRPHGFVNTLLGLFGAIALLTAVMVLFRSQRASNALTGHDESALRGLLARSGGEDSLGYFATRRDKAVVFAPSGRAAVTYRVEVGVCLASGDPIGDEEAWPHAIDAWLDLASTYGWTPAVMGASEAGATVYDRAGLTVLQLGDEAILNTRDFNLDGREMRQVRQAVNRVRKQDVTVRIRRRRDIPADDMTRVITLADAWRDTETERGFSMALGRLGDPADGDCLLVEALGPEDEAGDAEVLGILSLVPWGGNGVSLDLMRRNPEAPNGVVELMVTELATTADRFGINRISLNFAVFRAVFEEGARIGAGPVLRMWRSLLVFASKWWQLESLYRSNVKYQPEWAPRYLCFADRRVLPKVGVASAIAEGFLTLPSLRRHDASKHTGTREAVPAAISGTGTLHADGTAPDGVAAFAAPVPELPSAPRRPEQVRVRLDKLDRLAAMGIDAYPVATPPTYTVRDALDSPDDTSVTVSGRLLRLRDFGGVAFAVIRDWSGDAQVIVDADRLTRARVRDFSVASACTHSPTSGRACRTRRPGYGSGTWIWRSTPTREICWWHAVRW